MDDKFTRFEIARIIGARALQISMGAPLLIPQPKGQYNILELAKLEFEKGKIPITVKRLISGAPVLPGTPLDESEEVSPEIPEEEFDEELEDGIEEPESPPEEQLPEEA